ncbi:MAG: hypothetical protein ACI35O_13580 [Bacillaceae bacterium]
MKVVNVFSILVVCFIILVGCSINIETDGIQMEDAEETAITVQKAVNNENKYENIKVINNEQQINKVKKVLNKTNWKHAKVDMVRPPDYQFTIQTVTTKPEVKDVEAFKVWISPDKGKLEITKDDNYYIKLTKTNSETLFKIITGNSLSDME